jgi:hypothetical protein
MQRFNHNLSVALVVVGITLVGSAVFAKGGGVMVAALTVAAAMRPTPMFRLPM